MKQKTKLIIAVSMLLIVIFLLIGLIIIFANKISSIELPNYLATSAPTETAEIIETPANSITKTTEELTPTNEPTST